MHTYNTRGNVANFLFFQPPSIRLLYRPERNGSNKTAIFSYVYTNICIIHAYNNNVCNAVKCNPCRTKCYDEERIPRVAIFVGAHIVSRSRIVTHTPGPDELFKIIVCVNDLPGGLFKTRCLTRLQPSQYYRVSVENHLFGF